MTKEELQTLTDLIVTNWNLEVAGDRRRAFNRTWFRYLRDLPLADVQPAVDAAILADKPFPPRAGTIRRTVLADRLCDIPTVDAAWSQVVDRIRAAEQGTWTEVSPIVGQVMERAGLHGLSRDDREAFTRAWRQRIEELELERLALPDEEID